MPLRKFINGFAYAALGIKYALFTQRNMKIHFVAALLVLGLATYFKVETIEWLFLLLAITLVIMAEMFNTAIEAVVDLYVQDYHPLARIAKDVAAGAVLVTALGALAVGCIVFLPRLVAWWR